MIVSGLDGWFQTNDAYDSSAAYAIYDDDAGTITLLGGYSNGDWYWWYTGDESQYYLSYFFPGKADCDAKTFVGADMVEIYGLQPYGIIVLQPRSELRGSSGFGLERAGKAEDSQYIFGDYKYDKDNDTVGDAAGRSDVLQFWYMTKQQGSTSSVSKRKVSGSSIARPAKGFDRLPVRKKR